MIKLYVSLNFGKNNIVLKNIVVIFLEGEILWIICIYCILFFYIIKYVRVSMLFYYRRF